MPDIEIVVGDDGPDNFERGDAALHAVAFYMKKGRLPDINADEVLELGENAVQMLGATLPEGSPISFLIADLCHLLRRYDFDIEKALEHGICHFGSDCVEQAWQNDDARWHSCLQDPTNLPLATEILRANGVPMQFDYRIMQMTGLVPPEGSEEAA